MFLHGSSLKFVYQMRLCWWQCCYDAMPLIGWPYLKIAYDKFSWFPWSCLSFCHQCNLSTSCIRSCSAIEVTSWLVYTCVCAAVVCTGLVIFVVWLFTRWRWKAYASRFLREFHITCHEWLRYAWTKMRRKGRVLIWLFPSWRRWNQMLDSTSGHSYLCVLCSEISHQMSALLHLTWKQCHQFLHHTVNDNDVCKFAYLHSFYILQESLL